MWQNYLLLVRKFYVSRHKYFQNAHHITDGTETYHKGGK
jgi:hypothetical protein